MSVVLPYPNLTDKLLETKSHPDPSIAYARAALSGYAYSEQPTVQEVARQLALTIICARPTSSLWTSCSSTPPPTCSRAQTGA
jgi:hypothetical protein